MLKLLLGSTVVPLGRIARFSVNISNTGASTVSRVELSFKLPKGVQIIDGAPRGVIDEIAAGATQSLSLGILASTAGVFELSNVRLRGVDSNGAVGESSPNVRIAVIEPPPTVRVPGAHHRTQPNESNFGSESAAPVDVFVSYARDDADWIDRRILPALGFMRRADGRPPVVFVDRRSLLPGRRWDDAVLSVIQICRRVVAVFSPRYFESEPCLFEIQSAFSRDVSGRRGLLVTLEAAPCLIPTKYAALSRMDVRAEDFERRLAISLGLRIDPLKAPPEFLYPEA